GNAETRSEQASVVLASASGGVIRTVCCPQPATRSMTRAAPELRFSTVGNPVLPEPVSRHVGPPARARSDGDDRTSQGTRDTLQTLNPGHHQGDRKSVV